MSGTHAPPESASAAESGTITANAGMPAKFATAPAGWTTPNAAAITGAVAHCAAAVCAAAPGNQRSQSLRRRVSPSGNLRSTSTSGKSASRKRGASSTRPATARNDRWNPRSNTCAGSAATTIPAASASWSSGCDRRRADAATARAATNTDARTTGVSNRQTAQ
ncbi:MAG: hypothetical protein HMLKMBBP_00803 [Planctomycetes bacterium]|nr:hypothetical protein [Planctomycetota bacterium]